MTLPISAYATSLALDDDAVYLMAADAAFRLVEGAPANGIHLDLGIGPVLTSTAFIFWADGAIWSAPKEGGDRRELAKLPHQPQYFVGSGDALAWVDQSEQGAYSIQTLDGKRPRTLLTSLGEIRALNMIGDAVYFVERPSAQSWRIGLTRSTGAEPRYGSLHQGRAPSQLAGSDDIYYFDLDESAIIKVSADLAGSERIREVVCSPIHVSNRIYCGCVEGLFEVSKDTRQPNILSSNPSGSITNVISNGKLVAWTVDLGPNQLAVETLSVAGEPNR
ncbi:MAG TPA: hypothetical protein VEQ58_08620 [Polyangiaceae bacterium]|nr:hypothetical protein [Polyangiaceae bacterium]